MGMFLEINRAVGSLVTMVEDKGLDNDTTIIFLSDNGGEKDQYHGSADQGHSSHGPLRGEEGDI